ncbi:DUF3761 domain-containing protein [Massilia sp. TN1-12]|uniref:DUF3761 domain-containing protein n=1 Tax=Massilia paldalensis TaxID=3377675 RepID=UPI0038507739
MKLHHLLAVALFVSTSVHAQRAPDAAPYQFPTPASRSTIAPNTPAAPDETELLSHRHYKTKDGREVHSPSTSTHGQVPANASAKCRDGTYSFSQHRRGTCSHHGGVDTWL